MLLIIDKTCPNGFEVRPHTRLDALLSRLLASSIDRKLAAGHSPESDRLLAIRAQSLVAQGMRRTLARTLEEVLAKSARPRRARDRRVSPCRDRIMAAESDIRDIIACLSAPLPVPARGVAMVTALLRDGVGPLYNASCATDLRAVVREVVMALDPSLELIRG